MGSFFLLSNFQKNKETSISRTILSIITIYFSLIVLIEISLGILGKLNFLNVSLLSYLFFAFSYFLSRKNIAGFYKQIKISGNHSNQEKKSVLILLFFIPIGMVLFFRFFNAFLQVPLEYDAMVYHLPIVTEWFKTGSLLDVYYSAFAGPLAYYPSNFDLFYLWSIMPFKNDFLVNLLNLPLLILLTLTVYQIARNFSASKNVSLVVAVLLLYMPIFAQQVGTIFVDTFFILTFALAIYFLQEISKNPSEKKNVIFFGLALGLFVGTKYLGLVYSIIPLVIFLIIQLKQKIKRLQIICLAFLSVFLTGSFFYLRNWINADNPIFPAEVKIFDYTLFEGYPSVADSIATSTIFNNLSDLTTAKAFLKAFFIMTDIPGLLVFLCFLALPIYLFYLLKKKQKSLQDIWIGISLIIGGAALFILYLKAPYSYRDLIHNIRYAMPFLLTISVASGFLVSKFHKIRQIFYIVAFLACMRSLVYFFISPQYKIRLDWRILTEYGIYALLLALGILLLVFIFFTKRKVVAVSLLLLAGISLFEVVNFSIPKREQLASYFYNEWYPNDNMFSGILKASLWFDENAPYARIAYSGFHFHYPLFGRSLLRDVDYININECTDCRYVDYKNSLQSIRRDPDYAYWTYNLGKKEKDYLVVNPAITPQVRNYEFEWVAAHPEKFEFIEKFGETYIYKIM